MWPPDLPADPVIGRSWRVGALLRVGALMVGALSGCLPKSVVHGVEPTYARVDPDRILGDAAEADPGGAVRSVLLLAGDAGEVGAVERTFTALRAAAAGTDATLIWLGDNAYPAGTPVRCRPPAVADRETCAQVWAVRQQAQAIRPAPTYFVPGNHDWNQTPKLNLSAARMAVQREVILLAGARPLAYPGHPLVEQFDVGARLRVFAFDSERALDSAVYGDQVVDALRHGLLATPTDRIPVVVSHHPIDDLGPHAWADLRGRVSSPFVDVDASSAHYVRWRLAATALLDDLSADGREIVWATGHDHVLSALQRGSVWHLVSGAASKSNPIKDLTEAGTRVRFGAQRAGFMALVEREDGRVDVQVVTLESANEDSAAPPPGGGRRTFWLRLAPATIPATPAAP